MDRCWSFVTFHAELNIGVKGLNKKKNKSPTHKHVVCDSGNPRTLDVTSRVEALGAAAVEPPPANGGWPRVPLLRGLAGTTSLAIHAA